MSIGGFKPKVTVSNVVENVKKLATPSNAALTAAPPPTPVAATPPPPPPTPPPTPKRPQMDLPTLKKTAVDRIILDRSGIGREFDVNREKAQLSEGRSLQQGRDALARRAAQLGGGPGGALIKLEQQAMNDSADRLQMANREIDAAKDAEMRRVGELETQLNVAAQEAQAGRDLDKYKTELGAAVQKYGLDIGDAQFWADLGFKTGAQEFLEGQTAKENTENIRTNIISTIISLKNSGVPAEQVGGILKSIGYDYEALGIDPTKLTGVEGLTEKPVEAPKPQGIKLTGDQPVGNIVRASDGSGMYIDESGTRYVYKNGEFKKAGV